MPRPLIFASASAVEEAFYSALAHADLAGVMSLWADDEEVICIHPGGQRLVGLHAVRQSFEEILANGPLNIRIRDVQVFESATLSVHNLVEQIAVAGAQGHGTRSTCSPPTSTSRAAPAGSCSCIMRRPAQEAERPIHETPPGKLH